MQLAGGARGKAKLLSLLFFFSGATGLVYEVVWSRLLKDVFGVTAYAIAAVLATYLGGLALGSWALGRAADRRREPLRFYGLLEMGVALTAPISALAVPLMGPIHAWASGRLAPHSPALACVRLLLASIVVLPSTFLMGGTLPAVTKALVREMSGYGRGLGLLYALNTCGSVLGTLAAGFVLIGKIGVHPTLLLAAAANLAIGVTALALSQSEPSPAAPAAESPPAAAGDSSRLLAAVALSGVASLALEVIWTRVLVLIVGSSTYAFATMLSAFLLGIALGSFAARSFVDRLANPRAAFGWVQAGIAASTLLTIPLLWNLVASAQEWFLGKELDWVALAAGRFGVAFAILLVPTTLIGMSFPLAARIFARGSETLGSDLGRVYAWNALGNIAGAIAGGFFLLPLFGLQRSIAFAALFSLAAAAWGLLPAGPPRLLRAAPVLALFCLCAGLLALFRPQPFRSIEEGEGDPLLYYGEGVVSTVKVIRRADNGRQLVMLVDGVRIGESSAGVDRKQQVLAHFPFLLHPGPRRVLSIGLGTGILAGEVARHPGVERVECVELSPSVIEGARAFADFNGRALDDPRVRVIADDGVNFLKRSHARYDAIISDGKSRLGHAENSVFYSREFYRAARQHLAPGGLFLQWTPLEEVPEDLRTMVRTLIGEFPHAYLFLAQNSLYLIGMEQALAIDPARAQRVMEAPETAGLRRYGWRGADDLLGSFIADQDAARSWLSGEETVNSLERPVLEFYSLRALATPPAARVAANLEALAAIGPRSGPLRDTIEGLAQVARDEVPEGVRRLEQVLDEAPDRGMIRDWIADTFLELGHKLELQGDGDQAIYIDRRAVAANPESFRAHLGLGHALAAEGRVLEAAGHLRIALQLNPESGAAHRMLARILLSAGNAAAANEHLRAALRIAPDAPDLASFPPQR